MAKVLSINWWGLALRGAFGVVFGLITFFIPAVTLTVVTLLFGAYALVDGILSLVATYHSVSLHERWWPVMLEGLAGIGAAVITLLWPSLTLLALVYLIAAWAVITGILELIAAVRLRQHLRQEWLLAAAGIASMVFGVLLFAAPVAGAIVIAWWIGAYAFVFGALLLVLSFRVRGMSIVTRDDLTITAN